MTDLFILWITVMYMGASFLAYGYEYAYWQQSDKRYWKARLNRAHRHALFAAALGPWGLLLAYIDFLAAGCEFPQWHPIDWDRMPTEAELAAMRVDGW